MSSSQNVNDSSLSNIDITSDYRAQMDQLLHEAQMGLNRLSHNITRFNDSLQTMTAVGQQFAGAVYLWTSFHKSIKMATIDEMKPDEGAQSPVSEHLDVEQGMLEKEPEEDEKRQDGQQQFAHGTMNEPVVVLDSPSIDEN